jgi:hypothetical protein
VLVLPAARISGQVLDIICVLGWDNDSDPVARRKEMKNMGVGG